MKMQKIRWQLEKVLFLAVTYPVSLLPHRLSLSLGDLLGTLMYVALRRRRGIALQNVSKSLPWLKTRPGWSEGDVSPEEIVRRMFRNLGRSLMENFHLYHGRGREIIENVEFRGMENYHEAKKRGKGVAFITGHCGNWEMVGLACGDSYDGLAVVARRQDNPLLNDLVERMRSQYGNSIIYKEGALRQIFSKARKNENVAILVDQGVRRVEGVLIDFLGRPAWAMKMPSLIARKSGIALLPSFVHREGDRHVVTVNPAIELSSKEDEEGIKEDVKNLNSYIEDYIVHHPADWYWVHRRWKRAPASHP